jgi:8-amino-7-oxononanoate synthase
MPADPFAKKGLHDADAQLRASGVNAFFRTISARTADGYALIDGHRVIMAGSNDYLGLSQHPRVIEAAVEALHKYGASVSGSRSLNGSLDLHEELETRMAAFLGQPSAVVTTTGFQANLALAALLGRHDVAFSDRHNHASLIEGLRLGLGRIRGYRHADPEHLRARLATAPEESGRLIVTDGVFSMEGDAAPLRELRAVADEFGAKLIVDSAHDMGVWGARGAGLSEYLGIEDRADLITGTFSKAFGSIGGVLAGPAAHLDYLRFNARSAMFSAALPPASAAAALAALDLIVAEPERRRRLFRLGEALHNGLRVLGYDTGPSTTPIVPVAFPGVAAAGRFWAALMAEGVFTNLVGAPAISSGDGMLRLTLTAAHDESHLAAVLTAFAKVSDRLDPHRPATEIPPLKLADPVAEPHRRPAG